MKRGLKILQGNIWYIFAAYIAGAQDASFVSGFFAVASSSPFDYVENLFLDRGLFLFKEHQSIDYMRGTKRAGVSDSGAANTNSFDGPQIIMTYTTTPDYKIPLTSDGDSQAKMGGTQIKDVISNSGRFKN
ncbi:hypothetical protein Tco_0707437 [Tanacetum coccineum]|uniref:Uncharacterized protein n=1 Tax=Tanacetum coccineum TaxID=301880 RepID=A0ABQ4YBS6_9ASTR